MCGKAVACTKSTATRGVYVFQFILVAITAYLFSDWAYKWLPDVPGRYFLLFIACRSNDRISFEGMYIAG